MMSRAQRITTRLSPALALSLAAAASAQPCQPHWEAWGGGVSGGIVDNFATRTEAGVPVLYASGEFILAGTLPVNRVARWDGSSWSALGGGITGSPLPPNFPPYVTSLAFFGAPGSEQLFAGGAFANAGGQTANGIARWNGSAWSTFGAGLTVGFVNPPQINAMTVFDDGRGGGPALYIGGSFGTIAGVPAAGIAKWNGASWVSLPGATGAPYAWVIALQGFNDGSGPALYIGGNFTSIGGVPASRAAKWDGVSFSALGAGFDQGDIQALAVYNDGSGPALYASGTAQTSGGVPVNSIARLRNGAWEPVGSGLQYAATGHALGECMAVFDDGGEPALYIGGILDGGGGVASRGIVRYRAGVWESVGGGVDSTVWALTVHDDGLGAGPALYVGGQFSAAGGAPAASIARWTSCRCYANCDGSTVAPILNVNDFVCFQTRYAQGDPYANCDGSTIPPVLNVNDFTCFLNRFAAGCP